MLGSRATRRRKMASFSFFLTWPSLAAFLYLLIFSVFVYALLHTAQVAYCLHVGLSSTSQLLHQVRKGKMAAASPQIFHQYKDVKQAAGKQLDN